MLITITWAYCILMLFQIFTIEVYVFMELYFGPRKIYLILSITRYSSRPTRNFWEILWFGLKLSGYSYTVGGTCSKTCFKHKMVSKNRFFKKFIFGENLNTSLIQFFGALKLFCKYSYHWNNRRALLPYF